jgi:hypothetical protein
VANIDTVHSYSYRKRKMDVFTKEYNFDIALKG